MSLWLATTSARIAIQRLGGSPRDAGPRSSLLFPRYPQTTIKAEGSARRYTLRGTGIAPPKARAPLTVEQLAAAKAKRDATRAARHTLGKK